MKLKENNAVTDCCFLARACRRSGPPAYFYCSFTAL
jgi:hypothetical protein